jgi:hypothetical protein
MSNNEAFLAYISKTGDDEDDEWYYFLVSGI